MKKLLLPFFSCLLVVTLALSSFSSVTAAGGGDPWVTPVSGDMDFTATVVPIDRLPGVVELASQMLAPVGFPEGEAQFGGNGVRVTDFASGKATACFSISAQEVANGWGGKVGMWDGAKWVLLPTAIAPVAEEASTTSACAGITGNGTYAFIKWIADAGKLPTMKECDFDIYMDLTGYYTIFEDDYLQGWITGIMLWSEADLAGAPVSFRQLSAVPEGWFVIEGTGYGTLSAMGPGAYITVFNDFLWFTEQYGQAESLTFYLTIGNCYKVVDIMVSDR
jgi:hypothetical protein